MKTIFLILAGFLFFNTQLNSQPSFQKITAGSLVTTLNLSNFAAWGDYDNDDAAVLVNENQSPGSYSVNFNGANLPGGIYFYKPESGNFISLQKMTLVK